MLGSMQEGEVRQRSQHCHTGQGASQLERHMHCGSTCIDAWLGGACGSPLLAPVMARAKNSAAPSCRPAKVVWMSGRRWKHSGGTCTQARKEGRVRGARSGRSHSPVPMCLPPRACHDGPRPGPHIKRQCGSASIKGAVRVRPKRPGTCRSSSHYGTRSCARVASGRCPLRHLKPLKHLQHRT